MTVIETKNLVKSYHNGESELLAVNQVNLTIKAGEFAAVVGPSGSGKTTLLNLIGGLDVPTSGEVFVQNKNLTALSENERIDFRLNHIGFVFQAYNLIPVLSAEENTEFIMLLQNRPKAERQNRVKKLLDAMGLQGKHNHRPSELSGGQQQRVAVARALASKPAFILADEPTANLDSASTNNLLDLMAKMNEEEGVTFLFSTHDQRVIDKAKRVITIEDGKVVADVSR